MPRAAAQRLRQPLGSLSLGARELLDAERLARRPALGAALVVAALRVLVLRTGLIAGAIAVIVFALSWVVGLIY